MADNNTIARPYAQAVFEVAQESNALAELSESFAAARELMADGQVAAFLTRPTRSCRGCSRKRLARARCLPAVVITALIS
jgi:F0F1-type ATP synthase delta subunit